MRRCLGCPRRGKQDAGRACSKDRKRRSSPSPIPSARRRRHWGRASLANLRHLQEHEALREAAEMDGRDAGDWRIMTPRCHPTAPCEGDGMAPDVPIFTFVPRRHRESRRSSGVAIASKSPPSPRLRPLLPNINVTPRNNPFGRCRQSVSPSPPRLHPGASQCSRPECCLACPLVARPSGLFGPLGKRESSGLT